MTKIIKSPKYNVGLYKKGSMFHLFIKEKMVDTFDNKDNAMWHYRAAVRLLRMCG